jgi:hypothetical protein
MIEGDGSLDFVNNVYYWNDGSTPNNLMQMNLHTGAHAILHDVEIDSPVFINGANQIVGELSRNSSLVAMNLATGKISVLAPNPPALTSSFTQIWDANTKSYIVQVLDDNTEIYYWWAMNLATKQTRQANSAINFLGAHLCPVKIQ